MLHKKLKSTLENYTSSKHEAAPNNTTQHEPTRVEQETTRHNMSKTRPYPSTKEAQATKIGLYFALFVAKLQIFLVSFRNS